MKTEKKVWFITGGNKGLGAAIVKEALTQGYNVVATARNTESAEKALGNHPNLLIVKLDVTNEEEVKQSVAATTEQLGQIDVLDNNAGYGLLGYFEEMSEEAIRRQMETNLFGTMKVTRAILPIMRRQEKGLVIIVSSTSGIKAVPGGSVYSASKFALEGWSEGMNIDMKPFGIRFMLLEPGPFRTDFANESASMHLADTPIEAYNGLRENLHHIFHTMDGHQAGNPAKLAKGLIKVANTELLMSKISIPAVKEYYKNRYAEFEKWLDVSADSDYDE